MKKYQIGDIFQVLLSDKEKAYFQYICDDKSQLDSNVIQVFEKKFGINENPTSQEILNQNTSFFAHVVLKTGSTMKVWEFYSKANEAAIPNIYFRISSDYGNPGISKSDKWWVWKIGEDHKFIGNDVKILESAEIGIVINPKAIIQRIQNGKYSFFFPSF